MASGLPIETPVGRIRLRDTQPVFILIATTPLYHFFSGAILVESTAVLLPILCLLALHSCRHEDHDTFPFALPGGL